MPSQQQHYYDILMERVRDDRYPSHQLLDRLEATIFSSEQMIDYVDMLLEKVDDSWYPSGQLLDRIDRLLRLTAVVA
jgi:hypothetical protein